MKARIVGDRFEDAKMLVEHARRQFPGLRRLHAKSLEAEAVGAGLRVETKITLDVLRSALDYSAQELFIRFGSPNAKNRRTIGFPVSHDGTDGSRFGDLVGQKLPGLAENRPDLVKLLASFQEFTAPRNAWLPRFNTLCNTGKHDRLTGERSVKEYISVVYTSGGGLTRPEATFEQWTAIVFHETGDQILPFVEKTINGVSQIIGELKARA